MGLANPPEETADGHQTDFFLYKTSLFREQARKRLRLLSVLMHAR